MSPESRLSGQAKEPASVLWPDLGDLVEHFHAGTRQSAASHVYVSIWLSLRPGAESQPNLTWLLELASVANRPENGVRLGYDVADGAMLSGLSNCAYSPKEKARLSARWGDSLNQDGLFQAEDDAQRFALLTNTRVPEHAPFVVFELLQHDL
jgi:hypothetical protein